MKKRFGGALIALAFVFGIIATASTTVDAQWTNRSYGGYNNQQVQQGFQYGVNTGASDAQRRQSYSPQRSRYYRDASTQAFRCCRIGRRERLFEPLLLRPGAGFQCFDARLAQSSFT